VTGLDGDDVKRGTVLY